MKSIGYDPSKPNGGDDAKLSPEIIAGITTAFNEGLRQLISSVHEIMPDEAIVLNVITALFVARKKSGFNERDTVKEISKATNQNLHWAQELGRKT